MQKNINNFKTYFFRNFNLKKHQIYLLLTYLVLLVLFLILVYRNLYPLGVNSPGQWHWFSHPWTGLGAPLRQVILTIGIIGCGFNYLINRKTAVWLYILLNNLQLNLL